MAARGRRGVCWRREAATFGHLYAAGEGDEHGPNGGQGHEEVADDAHAGERQRRKGERLRLVRRQRRLPVHSATQYSCHSECSVAATRDRQRPRDAALLRRVCENAHIRTSTFRTKSASIVLVAAKTHLGSIVLVAAKTHRGSI
eukprot:8851224-Pyramimonas_sp.AAC.1